MPQLMIEDLMEAIVQKGGSDIHISAGLPPTSASMVTLSRQSMSLSRQRRCSG